MENKCDNGQHEYYKIQILSVNMYKLNSYIHKHSHIMYKKG